MSGIPINESIGLTSKMYSYLKDTNECGRTEKGIKKNVIKKDIKHKNYKDVLFNNKQVYHKMKMIRSQRHQLGSYEINTCSWQVAPGIMVSLTKNITLSEGAVKT